VGSEPLDGSSGGARHFEIPGRHSPKQRREIDRALGALLVVARQD
jgi:hypothetical protein